MIAGLVNVIGWLVAGRRELGRERRRRRERVRDVQTALRAEIRHYADALAVFDLDERWSTVVGRMEQDNNYMPTIPSERNDTVFRAMVSDVHVLPGAVIEPVVRYYNQIFAIEALIEDMRSDIVGRMDQPARIEMYTDYIALKKEALQQGRAAIAAIDSALSTPGADLSARQSGGGI